MTRYCACDHPECDGVHHPRFQPVAPDPDEVRRALERSRIWPNAGSRTVAVIHEAAEAWLAQQQPAPDVQALRGQIEAEVWEARKKHEAALAAENADVQAQIDAAVQRERGRVIGIFVGELQKLHEKTVLDCGDNSCLFATRRGGMRTNGGCRCIERLLDAAVAREREEHPVLCDVLMIADEMAADIDCEKTPGGLEHMGDVREWFRDAAAEIRARSAKGA